MSEEVLRRFYSHEGEFFILVREAGILVVEGPEEAAREGPPETILRLFMSITDAARYRERSKHRDDTQIMKTTIIGLWSLLPKIDKLAQAQFKAPVRVEVATVPEGKDAVTVDTLHSIYELLS